MGEEAPMTSAPVMSDIDVRPMAASLVDKVIQKLQNNHRSHAQDLQNTFTDLLFTALDDITARFTTYADQCSGFLKDGDFKRNLETFKSSVLCMERYVMHQFRQRKADMSVSQDMDDDDEVSGFAANAHRHALTHCRSQIVQEVNIEGTTLMDELISVNLMNDAERDSIIAKPTKKAKSEDFFRLISGRVTLEQTKNILLPAIHKHHPWISKEIRRNMKHAPDKEMTCVCCRMKDQVELKRVADHLLKDTAISMNQHTDLTNPAVPNSVKWKEILEESTPQLQQCVLASLENSYPDLYNEFQFDKITSLSCMCQKLLTAETASTAGTSISGEDVARMSDLISVTSLTSDMDLKAYRIQASGQNLSVILCNNNYSHLDEAVRKELTKMHECDIDKITKCFGRMNFTTECFLDHTGAEIVAWFQQLSSRVTLNRIGCLAVFILSLTEADSLLGTDAVPIPIDHCLAHFKIKRCPQLAGKPKLFFIQTCRGPDEDTGFVVPHDTDDPQSPWSVLPDDADFFVGLPTASGHQSYGMPGKGSVYISSLINILEKHAPKQDLLSCMHMVNETMAQMNLEFNGHCVKQISHPMFTLRKRLYLCGPQDGGPSSFSNSSR